MRLIILSRETVSADPSRVSFFLHRPRSDRHGYERPDPGPHGSFSCAPGNLVSRDGFGSPVPRQIFFVPSEIGSTRVRAIRSRAARLILVHACEFGLATRFRQSRPASFFFVPSEIGSTRVIRYTERAIRSRAARLLYQCNAPVREIRAIYPVLNSKIQRTFMNWETVSRSW